MLVGVIYQSWKNAWNCEVTLMNYVKRVVIYFLIGIGFGSLVYLFFLWQSGAEIQTVQQIANVVFISGLIGLVSMIFEVEAIPITWEILIHFCLVYGLYSWLEKLNGIIWSWHLLGEFSLTYLVIWFVIYISFNNRVKNINQRLREKNG